MTIYASSGSFPGSEDRQVLKFLHAGCIAVLNSNVNNDCMMI